MNFRPTEAVIHLKALEHNLVHITSLLPKTTKIIAIVKADAYGHGAVPVAKRLIVKGVHALGVATVEEGIELRESGIAVPIIVMGGMLGCGSAAAKAMIQAKLLPVIHSLDAIELLEGAASASTELSVHLQVDAGMNRLGVRLESLKSVLLRLQVSQVLKLVGVMTHFASAEDAVYTAYQAEQFELARTMILSHFSSVSLWHASNSEAIMRNVMTSREGECWGVRPGIALYGTVASHVLPPQIKLQPVMSLRSAISLLKWIPAGSRVSYGGTFVTKHKTRLAVVPIGYADGYPWNVSGRACVLVRGTRVPVIGRVTMDMIMLDVSALALTVQVGDEVILLGKQGNAFIDVSEISTWAETIPYEIFCGISKRIPRVCKE
ncbi:MAG: alanine racemase [Deltaproteobacteria bacterium RIFCSPHIGHO2_02_FULL_44_16]|nr:MAG: alanine racemase [Deltaproteobacteria bacterium RIFCSPHIGHO2_02_FULL_44_16]